MGDHVEATLNVRMSASLKERGDKVLRDAGVSASAAVRGLWQEMASTRTLPSFLVEMVEQDSERARKKRALDDLQGVAQGSLSLLSDAELAAVGMERYE